MKTKNKAGRKLLYGEKTGKKLISFPQSKEAEFITEVKKILKQWQTHEPQKGGYIRKRAKKRIVKRTLVKI